MLILLILHLFFNREDRTAGFDPDISRLDLNNSSYINSKTMTLRILLAICVFAFVTISCERRNITIIQGELENGAGNIAYLDKLEINRTLSIDSLKIRKNGQFKFKLKIEHPDIYFIRNNSGRFLTILPFPGENIEILGNYDYPGRNYTVSGSEESEKIRILNEKINDTKSRLKNLDASLEKVSSITDSQALEYLNRRKDIIKDQRDFSIRFIIENLKSIASIYATYQTLEQNQLVLGENRDIQYMKILADSISVKYPDVPVVKSFVDDARSAEKKYYNLLGISERLQKAEIGIPDLALPNMNGDTVNLSSFKGKIVLLYFWASGSQASRDQNPSLYSIYQKYKRRGFEVYAVSLDTQKEAWMRAIRFDELNWINVNEIRSLNSNAAASYNINSLPVNFLINRDGDIIARDLYGEELEKWLDNLL
jgi:thiol-disulfide isomerase/thioredoxin